MQTKALVVLSGGQDSTTCLAVAKSQFEEVHAVTFNYGQRHITEIKSAIAVAQAVGVSSHEIIDLGPILKGSSPLVSDNHLEQYDSPEQLPDGIATTVVPSRNALFLTIASNRAIVTGASVLYTGVSQADYSGYPDCRRDFIDRMEEALSFANFGESGHLSIRTPLMNITKAESVKLAQEVLGDSFESVFALTHTCYAGVIGGCGRCAACLLRDKGFREAGIPDPIWQYRC
jgi:7-cyano-7-deazaguanine synthase